MDSEGLAELVQDRWRRLLDRVILESAQVGRRDPGRTAASTAESSRTSRACRSAVPMDGAITLHHYS